MSCPAGQIRRASFRRKSGSRVKSSCVADRGRPGKGPKILPKPKKAGFLTKYGYSLDKSEKERRAALNKAMRNEDPVEVIRHLNLIRNITATGTDNKKKLARDVSYLSKKYQKTSRSRSVSRRKTSRRRRTTSKRKTSRRRTTSKRKTKKRSTSRRRKKSKSVRRRR